MYCALLGYIIFEGAEEDRNMNTLVDMISGMEVKEDDEDFLNAVDYMFKGLEQRKPNCFAVKQYKKYKLSSGKTAKSILISCGARLAPFDIPQLREIIRSCIILACQISLADIIGRAGGELAYAVQLRGTISGILVGEIKLILAEKLHAHKLGVVRC